MPDAIPVPPEADPREPLGRIVRETWVAYATEQGDTRLSHLAGWDDLDEGSREVDMRIGAAVAAAERERLLGAAGCPSPASPDRELAAELFKTVAFIAGPRTPVPHGTWLRESYGAGSVVCEECGRLAADSIEHEHLAGIARDHAAATGHQVIVQASRSALYGPKEECPGV